MEKRFYPIKDLILKIARRPDAQTRERSLQTSENLAAIITGMGDAAEIIKIDADILNLRTKLMSKNGTGDNKELKSRLDELLKRREQHLVEFEKKARGRIA